MFRNLCYENFDLRRASFFSTISLIVLLVFLPRLISSDYQLHVFIMILYFAYASSCWNISGGLVGLHSFGHAVYVGIGAYTSSLLFVHWQVSPWLGMWVGAIAATLASLFIGYISIHYEVKGIYYILITMAFAEIFRISTLNLKFTGGPSGILIPLKGEVPWLFQFASKKGYYYVILALTLGILVFIHFLKKSRVGYYFTAIRENEEAAQSIGINLLKYKLISIGMSAFFIALCGTYWVQYFLHVEPNTIFGIGLSMEILIYAIVGGEGTLLGPLIGAAVLLPFSELFRVYLGGSFKGMHLIAYGIILILIMIFNPNGIAGLIVGKIRHSKFLYTLGEEKHEFTGDRKSF